MSNFCDYLALPMLYVSLVFSVRFLKWDPFVICIVLFGECSTGDGVLFVSCISLVDPKLLE